MAFLKHAGERVVSDFSVPDLRGYLCWLSMDLRLKSNTLHSRLNALKFFYEQVLSRDKFFLGDTAAAEAPYTAKSIVGA